MARHLTHKERGFVNDIADGKTGVQAALDNYDTKDYNTAAAIASENLNKPKLIEELRKLGFDSNNAKRVVAEILNDDMQESKDRLTAADKIFKVMGDYAPEKHLNVNVDLSPTERIRKLAEKLKAVQYSNVERVKDDTRTVSEDK